MIVLRKYALHDTKTHEWSYRVERCRQPLIDVIRHRIFHDVIERMAKPFIPFVRWDTSSDDPMDWGLPLDVRFDFWCYELSQKNVKVLEEFDLNQATWEELKVRG